MIYPAQTALNGYAIVWLYVMFDLPVETKQQRHDATRFRKELLRDGFSMEQFSVYIRHCPSHEAAKVHIDRVRKIVPDEGRVSILKVTDKQFGDTINIYGGRRKPPPETPEQLDLF